jgi:Activator of Hsp90 ATPase homolog 1-like protein
MSPHTRGLEPLITVTFQKKGADTLMTLRHENLPGDEYGRGHEKGWGSEWHCQLQSLINAVVA